MENLLRHGAYLELDLCRVHPAWLDLYIAVETLLRAEEYLSSTEPRKQNAKHHPAEGLVHGEGHSCLARMIAWNEALRGEPLNVEIHTRIVRSREWPLQIHLDDEPALSSSATARQARKGRGGAEEIEGKCSLRRESTSHFNGLAATNKPENVEAELLASEVDELSFSVRHSISRPSVRPQSKEIRSVATEDSQEMLHELSQRQERYKNLMQLHDKAEREYGDLWPVRYHSLNDEAGAGQGGEFSKLSDLLRKHDCIGKDENSSISKPRMSPTLESQVNQQGDQPKLRSFLTNLGIGRTETIAAIVVERVSGMSQTNEDKSTPEEAKQL
jgi:hypothetical protein